MLDQAGKHAEYIVKPSLLHLMNQERNSSTMLNTEIQSSKEIDENLLKQTRIKIQSKYPIIQEQITNEVLTTGMLDAFVQGVFHGGSGAYILKINDTDYLVGMHWFEIIDKIPLKDFLPIVEFIPKSLGPNIALRAGKEVLNLPEESIREISTPEVIENQEGNGYKLNLSFRVNDDELSSLIVPLINPPELPPEEDDTDGWRPSMMCALVASSAEIGIG